MLLLDEAVRLNMSRKEGMAVREDSVSAVSEANAEKPDTEKADAGRTDTEETDAEKPDTEKTDAEKPDAEETDAEKTDPGIAGSVEKESAASGKIRVLLMDTGYVSYFHPSVTVVYNGEEATYTASGQELKDSPLIIPEQENGIRITTIERQQGHPVYQGSLEIRDTPEGILLINELPLETYLESVVPSEMPSSYASDALKAQAVCARTYACRQMQEGSMEEYGADVDDSVRFQVYGNIAPQESTTAAVHATEGQVLCQNGELIQAYYFSTSSGATSTDEIWGAEEAASYLKAVSCDFDQEEPWSSWTVTIPWDELADRAVSYPLDTQFGEVSDAVPALKTLEITRKNQSNAVIGLRVLTDAGAFELSEEYAIREFLAPSGCMITEKDGSVTQGGALLPSAYFTMEAVQGEYVEIQGKGYGHGVGMSQTAADQMAARGYCYTEILDYFFKNVEIQQVDTNGVSW